MSQADLLKSVFRSDPAEGPGDQRPEAEDSRSDGRHAQHLLHSRHQQHDPRGPPLLLKVYGHQSLQPGPQRLRLPASQKVNPPPPPRHPSSCPFYCSCRPATSRLRTWGFFCLFLFGVFLVWFSPCQVRRMLYCVTVFVVVKTKENLKNKQTWKSHIS